MTITIISNDIIKGALISLLKSYSALTNKLVEYGTGAVEIREYQWKGQEFDYPNIRVRIVRNVPELGDCAKANFTASVFTFTEDQTSAMCDEISGIIAAYFHVQQIGLSFEGNAYNFGFGGVSVVPAINIGNNLSWRSEVILEGFVSLE